MALLGGSGKDGKVRYAVVGIGWITQEVVLPGFKDAKHSELAALVTDDGKKAKALAKKYGVGRTADYDGYDELLRSGEIDAVYIGLPNNLHRDYTVRAANAGIHVLCEKPMADNVAECQDMIRAAEERNVKLMIAYRLHFEPGNLEAVETVTSGKIGEPRIFSSVFSQQVDEGNVRLKKNLGGGPLMDMGVYPINAARYLFRDEPVEVVGVGANGGDSRFNEVHEMATAILRFPGDRMAVLTCSFGASSSDSFQVVGTKGSILMKPAFDYHSPGKLMTTIDDKQTTKKFDQVDQFGGEIEYFSRCILDNSQPEPDGYEGLADIRIVEALLASMRDGKPVKLEPFEKKQRPGEEQKMEKPYVKPERKLVNAKSASGE